MAQGAKAYVTDLVLGLLDSLELRGVCHHAEASAFILLKLLLVAHLQGRREGRERHRSEARNLRPALKQQPAQTGIGSRRERA